MRLFIAAAALVLALPAVPVSAYENFIPLGHAYSPDDPQLPAFNSAQDQINSRVDIYESEIYVRQRTAKEFNSQLTQFSNDQELKGGRDFIDY